MKVWKPTKKYTKNQNAAQAEASVRIRELEQEVAALKEKNAELQHDLLEDDLTGLYNARALRERLADSIRQFENEGTVPALLFIDVDHFKSINEMHGHQAAGRVLEQVGRIIARVVRNHDLAFRYGGDEFVVLVSGGENGAWLVGERIRKTIEDTEFRVRGLRGGQAVRLTVSVGARVMRKGDRVEQLLQDADRAMFEAKRNSRNCFVAA